MGSEMCIRDRDIFVSKDFSDGDRDKLPGFDISESDTRNIL